MSDYVTARSADLYSLKRHRMAHSVLSFRCCDYKCHQADFLVGLVCVRYLERFGSRAADSGAFGWVSLAPCFNLHTLRYSEEIFSQLVVIHTTQLVANPKVLSLHCAIENR